MTREELIELINDLKDELEILMNRCDEALVEDDYQAEEEEAPEADFEVDDIIDFVNVNKDGDMEFLTGRVIEGPRRDENGWYCRAETREGRKFKVPTNLTETRLGTRVQRVHER